MLKQQGKKTSQSSLHNKQKRPTTKKATKPLRKVSQQSRTFKTTTSQSTPLTNTTISSRQGKKIPSQQYFGTKASVSLSNIQDSTATASLFPFSSSSLASSPLTVKKPFTSFRSRFSTSTKGNNDEESAVSTLREQETAALSAQKPKKVLPEGAIVTNESFNAPAVQDRDVHSVDPKPDVVTEDLLLAKINYEAKVKNNRWFRFSEYLRDHQPQTRAMILAIPSIAAMWATHDFSLYLASLTDQLGGSAETTSNMLMTLGGVQALVGYGLFTNANKILSLAGQPSEPIVQEIIRRSLRNPQLHDALGGHFKIGHFVSVSTRPGGPRWTNNKARHYEEWLQHDAGKFTQPIPDIPVPKMMQKYLSLFPAFQSTAWNVAVAERVALDMKQHPRDYIDNSDSSTEEDMNVGNDGKTLLLEGKGIKRNDNNSESTDEQSQQPGKPLTEQEAKMRKTTVANYSGWERFWKPRRLQFTAHLVGAQDEGLLLCEVEKLNFGPSFKGSGGMTQYKVFQFVSLKTGQVTNINQSERPSLLSHAHVQQLFDTIPVIHPVVSVATFDHILVEDKYKKETKKFLAEEKKKVDVGIYH